MSKTINAAVYERHGNPPDVLQIKTEPWPKPATDEVVVQMRAAPINPADINEKTLAPIVKDIKSGDADLRLTAIKALALMGPAAKTAVQDLIDALRASTDPGTHRI